MYDSVPRLHLFARCSITIRVVTQPSEEFDGTTNVSFGVVDGFLQSNMSAASTSDADKDGYVQINYTQAHQTQGETALQSSAGELVPGGIVNAVSFDVTFYHCGPGGFWDLNHGSGNDSDGSGGTCHYCTEGIGGVQEVSLKGGSGGCIRRIVLIINACDLLPTHTTLVHTEVNTSRKAWHCPASTPVDCVGY